MYHNDLNVRRVMVITEYFAIANLSLLHEHVLTVKKKNQWTCSWTSNNLPPCLSVDPPCAPNPRTSETVTPLIPIFKKAFSNYENREKAQIFFLHIMT